MEVSQGTMGEIERALNRYVEKVDSTNLTDNSKWTYIEHATNFVRWLRGDFEPGSGVEQRQTTNRG